MVGSGSGGRRAPPPVLPCVLVTAASYCRLPQPRARSTSPYGSCLRPSVVAGATMRSWQQLPSWRACWRQRRRASVTWSATRGPARLSGRRTASAGCWGPSRCVVGAHAQTNQGGGNEDPRRQKRQTAGRPAGSALPLPFGRGGGGGAVRPHQTYFSSATVPAYFQTITASSSRPPRCHTAAGPGERV